MLTYFLFGHSIYGCVDADYEHDTQTDGQKCRGKYCASMHAVRRAVKTTGQ